MFLQEVKKALFPIRAASATRSSDEPSGAPFSDEFFEPSSEIRTAVRRLRLGISRNLVSKSGQVSNAPAAYEAYPVHKRAAARAGFAASDALIITRFMLSAADDAMSRLLNAPVEDRSVLDFELGGLELAWHSDLQKALEGRTAVWSVSRIVLTSGDLVLEHVAIPRRSATGQLVFAGWYHRIDGSLVGDPKWSTVTSFSRERRGQRISNQLPPAPLPEPTNTEPACHPQRDMVSDFRSKGII